MADKIARQALLRAVEGLAPYPAMLMPTQGGWEVVFPNLARLTAWGPNKDMACHNGEEALTLTLGQMIAAGDEPPRPSDPERLVPDEEEPPGSELIMLEPDKAVLRARLGLTQKEKGSPLGSTLGRLGRK
ncbi:MAG: type II toxin-antitoxin system HicB family antitoxin [Desulfarculaceae bacterium]|nr:type II toxin-antitoxin system HicB family antitoxin [Desulfarculaceae bacterium]